MTTRAERRHQQAVRKMAVRRILKEAWQQRTLALNVRFVGRMAAAPKSCSSRCCGNARYWEGATLQEQRAAEDVE